TFFSTNRPTRIGQDSDWVAFSAGGAGWRGAQSAAIRRDGSLWVWGNWKRIKLPKGIANPTDTNLFNRPTRLGLDTDWVRVACGNDFGVALKSVGTLWTWGTGAPDRLSEIKIPATGAPIAQIGSDRDWVNVVAEGNGLGGETTIHALKTDGTVWSWGANIFPASGGVPTISNVGLGTARQISSLGKAIARPIIPTQAENGAR
ncbi:MAG: copper amine oxidase domain protein, partial [Verrucomicrobiales bacterium]|nr:copper amine oxidase domain protein [Verrucomicrobiales bacterium]